MIRFTFLSVLAIFSIGMVSAQAYQGSIQYDKKKQQAVLIDFSYPPEAVENAFIQKMARLGYKPKEEKGFLNKDKGFFVFKNAAVTDISRERMDYIIRVERKSRKEKDEAVLYMIMSKEDENLMPQMTAADVNKAKSFLNTLEPDVIAADLELQIIAQEEAIAKSEKKLKELKVDQVSLEKKLTENLADQDSTQRDIENQRHALGILLGKRKS